MILQHELLLFLSLFTLLTELFTPELFMQVGL